MTRSFEPYNGTRTILGDKESGRYFPCPSGETISFLGKCNGYQECFDGSDEVNCKRTACKYCQLRGEIFILAYRPEFP